MPESSKTYLARARPCGRSRGGGTNRCGRRAVGSRKTVLMLRIAMRPFRTRIHLWRRRRRRVALILSSHVVALGRVRRVRRRIGWAGGRNRGIYRNVSVRLHVRLIAMAIWMPIAQRVHGRTCCLSHTWRTSGLRVRRVVVLRRAGQVLRVSGRARGWRRLVQTVVGLRRVGGSAGSDLRLRRVLRVRARLGLRGVLSRGSSRSLVCSCKFRMCRGRCWKR